MKILKPGVLGVLFFLFYVNASAQTAVLNEPDRSKPRLFADLPEKMNLYVTDLESLLDLPLGSTVSRKLSDGFQFEGTVISRSDAQDAHVKSIVIRSTNKKGATFTFSRITDAAGNASFAGRIISLKNGDVLELVKEKGQYLFRKRELYDLVSE
ncbi:MAG TPA: hypothetical protein VHK91_03105 [Flavisolibacter sp.]|jgi:hypothetical protein|nr:hypothetical protein [Flavisolibacter sp.]